VSDGPAETLDVLVQADRCFRQSFLRELLDPPRGEVELVRALLELPDPGGDAVTHPSFSGSGNGGLFCVSCFFLRLFHWRSFAALVRAFAAARDALIAISRRRAFVSDRDLAIPPMRPVRTRSRFIARVSFFISSS